MFCKGDTRAKFLVWKQLKWQEVGKKMLVHVLYIHHTFLTIIFFSPLLLPTFLHLTISFYRIVAFPCFSLTLIHFQLILWNETFPKLHEEKQKISFPFFLPWKLFSAVTLSVHCFWSTYTTLMSLCCYLSQLTFVYFNWCFFSVSVFGQCGILACTDTTDWDLCELWSSDNGAFLLWNTTFQ